MLKKHKIWIGAGVIAATIGAISGRSGWFVPTTWSDPNRPYDSGEGGEGGEAGEGEVNASHAFASQQPGTFAAAEGGEHGEIAMQADGRAADSPGRSFDDALKLVLDGEGGKDGIGISLLTKNDNTWGFSVPVLTAEEIEKALPGNSLRSERHFALYFGSSGQFRGWSLSWTTAQMSQCPSRLGRNHGVFDGECYVATANSLQGSWSLKGDTLCLTPSPKSVTDGHECVRAALILNNVLLFSPDGRMIGKGSDLVRGENILRERSG